MAPTQPATTRVHYITTQRYLFFIYHHRDEDEDGGVGAYVKGNLKLKQRKELDELDTNIEKS